ncbi:nucleotidyl transferase AbiEii/AbiGii toxin family protein [Pseudoalteromonas shioyasakiensis]|uniref:nucleotidyl transferase AbiEii/AbiGii toxin family protein n=1 Tax=Pseudoalteromonas shioyasakiensis TaxID=1190813 RepID=UPI002117F097|nr:nucleotidyl transferase AbiEii/AbiGii toxin family protein [Pseudoalteromonas shioyasakiensis]MCQ8878728.1 nucleotidyl transferase AbiEii/AbiGii toxin family protein [Pseudoalteromonas shioyasakiensis]
MQNTSLNVASKLPRGLAELYRLINAQADALAISYLVIGATARDIILHHGFGAAIERGTRDVDFAIQVKSWQQFEQLKAKLLANGFKAHETKAHQLIISLTDGDEWEVDIIPFGAIAGDSHSITWPPQYDIEMSVIGFNEAFNNALNVTISVTPKLEIKVASPEGMLLLKLKSWQEREPHIRGKDAIDIYYLIKHYSKIPEVNDSLYNDDFMGAQDFDELKASAMKLASDAQEIASTDTLSFIMNKVCNDGAKRDQLILDMSRKVHIEYGEAEKLIAIIFEQLIKK